MPPTASKSAARQNSDQTQKQTEIEHYHPQIYDLQALFPNYWHNKNVESKKENWGFPRGASILLSGEPGTGKSFFALSLARGVLFSEEVRQKRGSHVLYMISAEHDRNRLLRDFDNTGWFDSEDPCFNPEDDSKAKGWDKRSDPVFVHISAHIELNRPVPNSEELINHLLSELKERHAKRPPGTKAIVIIDSLTALLRDCGNVGEERRQTHELICRLETALGKDQLALTFFLSEQPRVWPAVVGVEEYVVDFVFRLNLERTDGGRRLRVLEVVKSHGISLHLGRHTWSMVYHDAWDAVLSQDEMKSHIEFLATGNAQHPTNQSETNLPNLKSYPSGIRNSLKWATVVIFAHGVLPGIGDRDKSNTHTNPQNPDWIFSGIPGLDEMLNFWPHGRRYWVERELGLKSAEGAAKNATEKISKEAASQATAENAARGAEIIAKNAKDTADIAKKKAIKYERLAILAIWVANKVKTTSNKAKGHSKRTATTKATKFATRTADSVRNAMKAKKEATAAERDADRAWKTAATARETAEMAKKETEAARRIYWGIRQGTITVVTGTAGAGKTTMCQQFLLGDNQPHKSLYINFEEPWDQIIRHSMRSADLKEVHDIYRRRSNLDVGALLTEIRFLCMLHRVERIAIDGLSSLLATTTEKEYAQLIERLIATIRDLSRKLKTEISLFITYEPEEQQERDEYEQPRLAALADNLIIIWDVVIEDEVRHAIYIAKASNMSHDRTVREIRVKDQSKYPVRIEPGLESYAGLLGDNPEPVKLALQLFYENECENDYNNRLKEHLNNVFKYDVAIFGYSRTAISRTLREMESAEIRLPASHVRVLTLDEWVIQDLNANSQQSKQPDKNRAIDERIEDVGGQEEPLLPLVPFERSRDSPHDGCPLNTRATDFFCWDLAKGRFKSEDPDTRSLVALPLYLDFGMFCVNARLAAEIGIIRLADADKRTSSEPTTLNSLERDIWLKLLTKTPRFWANIDRKNTSWFAPPKASGRPAVLVDLMKRIAKLRENKWGFVFDIATTETAGNFFLELCWGFGATPRVFCEREKDQKQKNREAAQWSLRLLMFMVAEGLMPPNPSINQSDKTLFSRHFYSTFCDCARPRSYSPNNRSQLSSPDHASRSTKRNQDLFLLPFLPLGATSNNGSIVDNLKKDIIQRLATAMDLGMLQHSGDAFDQIWEALTNESVDADMLREARQINSRNTLFMRRAGKDSPGPDFHDERQFQRRHDLRMEMMAGKWPEGGPTPFPTGYCCSGAWLVGVHGHTHSAGLSCKLIDEMTSLECVTERARMGAGIPARKDFYRFYGDEPVTHASYLTWLELLTFCGSRVRTRQTAVAFPGGSVRQMNVVLHKYIQAAIQYADAKKRGEGKNAHLSIVADQFVDEIFRHLSRKEK